MGELVLYHTNSKVEGFDNRANADDSHSIANLEALNTDGFDVSGRDIYIHDSSVWNQDDCFTIVPLTRSGINTRSARRTS